MSPNCAASPDCSGLIRDGFSTPYAFCTIPRVLDAIGLEVDLADPGIRDRLGSIPRRVLQRMIADPIDVVQHPANDLDSERGRVSVVLHQVVDAEQHAAHRFQGELACWAVVSRAAFFVSVDARRLGFLFLARAYHRPVSVRFGRRDARWHPSCVLAFVPRRRHRLLFRHRACRFMPRPASTRRSCRRCRPATPTARGSPR